MSPCNYSGNSKALPCDIYRARGDLLNNFFRISWMLLALPAPVTDSSLDMNMQRNMWQWCSSFWQYSSLALPACTTTCTCSFPILSATWHLFLRKRHKLTQRHFKNAALCQILSANLCYFHCCVISCLVDHRPEILEFQDPEIRAVKTAESLKISIRRWNMMWLMKIVYEEEEIQEEMRLEEQKKLKWEFRSEIGFK